MNIHISTSKSPWIFFLLVFILSIPFWLAGTVVERFLPKDIPINLPFSALMVVCTISAAALLTYRENGWGGVKQLLKMTFDYKRIKLKIWYLPIFLLMPSLSVLEYGLMKLTGATFPDMQIPILMAPALFVMFLVSGACEEIGWSGYAIEPLQARWGALGASLIVGVVWGVWHAVPYIQAHNAPLWIVWQCAVTIGNRVLIVWVYNNTGKSVLAATLFHAMYNVCWSLYPNYGSHYDPVVVFVITAATAAVVIILWGPKTLTHYRYARQHENNPATA